MKDLECHGARVGDIMLAPALSGCIALATPCQHDLGERTAAELVLGSEQFAWILYTHDVRRPAARITLAQHCIEAASANLLEEEIGSLGARDQVSSDAILLDDVAAPLLLGREEVQKIGNQAWLGLDLCASDARFLEELGCRRRRLVEHLPHFGHGGSRCHRVGDSIMLPNAKPHTRARGWLLPAITKEVWRGCTYNVRVVRGRINLLHRGENVLEERQVVVRLALHRLLGMASDVSKHLIHAIDKSVNPPRSPSTATDGVLRSDEHAEWQDSARDRER